MTYDILKAFVKPLLARDEGEESHLYSDAKGPKVKIVDPYGGKLTIGIGWNIEDRGLPKEIIDRLFDIACDDAIKDAERLYPNFSKMSIPRQAAIINLCYNMGYSRLSAFVPTNALIKSGQFTKAAARLRNTLYAKQLPGRSSRVANLLEFEREK